MWVQIRDARMLKITILIIIYTAQSLSWPHHSQASFRTAALYWGKWERSSSKVKVMHLRVTWSVVMAQQCKLHRQGKCDDDPVCHNKTQDLWRACRCVMASHDLGVASGGKINKKDTFQSCFGISQTLLCLSCGHISLIVSDNVNPVTHMSLLICTEFY